MFKANSTRGPRLIAALVVAAFFAGMSFTGTAQAGGGCALVANQADPSEKILRCGDNLVVQAAPGTSYRPVYQQGEGFPSAIRLYSGALLIEFHPRKPGEGFQILTPLAVAAVRGTKWAMDVSPAKTSALVLDGAVGVTNLHLNEYVILTEGEGVDIAPGDTTLVQKRWGEARIRALLSRFGQ
jgi:hypothetical protein